MKALVENPAVYSSNFPIPLLLEMADDLTLICEKLDDLLKEFFEEWGKYKGLRNELSSSMKDGFLQISKSRYSMGVGSVSELQIPDGEFQPLLECRPVEDEDGTEVLEFIKHLTTSSTKKSVENEIIDSDKKEGQSVTAESEPTLRRRVTKGNSIRIRPLGHFREG